MSKGFFRSDAAMTMMARVRLCTAFVLLVFSLVLFDHAARNAALADAHAAQAQPIAQVLSTPVVTAELEHLTVA